MSTVYPYRARAMMRFKAQDGQFVLSPDQIVTVTATTDEDGDWVNVENGEGQSGSVPSGFLVAIEGQVKEAGETDQPASTPVVESSLRSVELPSSTTSAPAPSQPEAVLSNPSKPSTEMEATDATSAEPSSVPPNVGSTDPPVSAQTPSKPEEITPTASTLPPPPPPTKPNALRDRIAMFNKAPSAAQPAAPGSLRPKPPLARKPMNMPPPAPPVVVSDGKEDNSTTAEGNSSHSNAPAGMSAADAEESVRAGGSLKDRIRLLQQQQQASEASEVTPSAAPKPKREWKRPVAPPSTDDLPPILGMKPPMPARLPSKESDINEPGNEPGAPADSSPKPLPISTTIPDESLVGDPEEEEEDIARRRRIAERMAKLGGAKMGFGIPGPALGSKPPLPPKSAQGNVSEPNEDNSNTIIETALPPDRIAIPAMPKRAGPPRRKPPATKPAEPAVVQTEPAQIEGSQTEEAAGPSLVDTTDQPVIDTAETTPVDTLQSTTVGANGEFEVPEGALDDAISISHPTSQSLDVKQETALQHYSEDKEASLNLGEASGPIDASLDTPRHVPEDSSAESTHVHSTDNHEGGTPALGMPTPHVPPPHSPVLSSDSQALDADPPQDISRPVDDDETRENVISAERSAPLSLDSDDVDDSHEDKNLEAEDAEVIERKEEVRPPADSTHATHSRDVDQPPLEHTPRPPLPQAPVPMFNQPIVASTDEDDTPDVEHRQSFAKKMAAIGGRPMLPPISPRGELRRPSGPREPKSPLKGVPIDELSPAHGGSDNELLTQKAPPQSQLPPIPSSRPLPQPDLSSSRTAADPTRPELTAERPDSLDDSPIVEPSVTEPVSSADHQENEEDEDEESARRRRLAERMAKMGGRSMMGGMMPMFSNSPSAARKPATASQSGSHPLPSVPLNLASTPPIPSSRPLPPPPSGLITPSSEGRATSPISVPSPPRRAAPSPMYRAPSSGLGQSGDDFSRSPIESSPTMPSSPPPLSPAGRPKVPTAYQNPTKRASTLSQPGHTWSHVDEPRSMHQQDVEEEEDYLPLSDNDECGPPPIPPPRPPPVSGMSMGSPKPPTIVSDDPSRSSIDSDRSSNPRSSMTERDRVISGSPRMSSTNTSGEGIRKVSHNSQFTHKARDLDLASERWWRTKPVSVPSSVQSMKDVLVRLQGSSTLQKGVSTYDYELIVIRDDYSKTVVRIHFEDGDESATEMTQTHYPPPKPYPISTLQELNASIGPQLVARAKAKEDEKGVKFVGAEEDGKTFVGMIVKSVGAALEPVGETFGEVIYKCEIQDFKAAHPEVDVKDDIRPGDIVASYGASFKGKGIGHGSMNLGTVTNAHVAIVAEHDVKKNKFKAYGVWHGKVELISYRIDELKSGSIKVFRVLDKKFLEN